MSVMGYLRRKDWRRSPAASRNGSSGFPRRLRLGRGEQRRHLVGAGDGADAAPLGVSGWRERHPAGHVALNLLAPVLAGEAVADDLALHLRSEEHTSELQSLMRISYAVF